MAHFKLFLILNAKDWDTAKKSIPYLQKNINSDGITVVSSKRLQHEDLCGCSFLDEDQILKQHYNLSFASVSAYLASIGAKLENTGWYLQQFLKLGLSKIVTDAYYLVWDADTIPLNPLEFFDKDGHPYFNLKREYFSSYFRTIENLFGIKKRTKESFISEHMLFNTAVVQEMLAHIENNPRLTGENFWQKIIQAADLFHHDNIKHDQRFFSEFETFGTYCDSFYPNLYTHRKLRTLRHGADFLGFNPSDAILIWAANSFDTISFEQWASPPPVRTSCIN